MESVSRYFGKLDLAEPAISGEQLVLSAWRGAVGKKIADRTRPHKLVRTRLVIDVEDRVWQKQLFALSRQILANLEKKVGHGLVDDLEFRVAPRRIPPQRATASLPLLDDEAAGISDPVMRHIYKHARLKERA
jgi:hypothetical protein